MNLGAFPGVILLLLLLLLLFVDIEEPVNIVGIVIACQ